MALAMVTEGVGRRLIYVRNKIDWNRADLRLAGLPGNDLSMTKVLPEI